MNLTGTTKNLLLVYPSMDRATLKERVDIMLAPQFYTLKKEALPVKYAYQAKKIAPSLFEGLLEEGGQYEYMVFKRDNLWVFVAYDTNKITEFLSSKGIQSSMVSKVFFAEQIADKLVAPVSLGEKEAMVVLDDSVVVVPVSVLGDNERPLLKFDKTFAPSKGISLQGDAGSFLTAKQSYALAAVLLLFAVLFIIEGSRYGNIQNNREQMHSLYAAYPALQSSYAREEILGRYRQIDTKERKKRDIVKKISGMIFKGITLTDLTLGQSGYKAEFACVSASVAKKLKTIAKKENLKAIKAKSSNNITIEGAI